MPQARTESKNITKAPETSVWLAYNRTGFIVLGNPSKSPTGLHGSAKRPHGNASASPRKSDLGTDASGSVVETLDYYPYGGVRVDSDTGSYQGEQRKYIGQINDGGSGLDYLNARYYNANQGQFISQDPVFLGDPKGQNLQDPQSLNSYSYGEDNPITNKDTNGKQTASYLAIQLQILSLELEILSLQAVIIATTEATAPYVAVGAVVAATIVAGGAYSSHGGISTPSPSFSSAQSTSAFGGSVAVQAAPAPPVASRSYESGISQFTSQQSAVPLGYLQSSNKPTGWINAPSNPWESPGPGWEPIPGSIKDPDQRPYKDWYNPETKQTLHPDFDHPAPEGPHWDLKGPDGSYRVPPGGGVPTPK